MTVSDPGAGQQQGRECGNCGHPKESHGSSGCHVLIGLFGGPVECRCRVFSVKTVAAASANPYPSTWVAAPSPTPPARDSGQTCVDRCHAYGLGDCPCARDSGRDEAREAVARWLWEQDGYLGTWEREERKDDYRQDADRLLALPELDKLLRRPA